MTVQRPLAVAAALLGLSLVAMPAQASPNPAPPAGESTAPASPGLQPCAPSDLSLRQAGRTSPTDPAAGTIFVLRNRGAAPCRLVGGVGIRLFDADAKEISLRFAPRTMMAMLLTLAPDAEASFTVTALPHDATDCTAGTRIDVSIPGQPAPVSAQTTLAGCSGTVLAVSNLRLGVPLTRSSSPFA